MKIIIWWMRRDLRLKDNPALAAAIEAGEQVIPLFILDPALVNSTYIGLKRLNFLYSALQSMDQSLQKLGSRLVIRSGEPSIVLKGIVQETGASGIYAEEDYSSFARRRDTKVARDLPLHLVGFPTIYSPEAVVKQDGKPYTVFTPFSKAWKSLHFPSSVIHPPDYIHTPEGVATLELPAVTGRPEDCCFPPSESEAIRRLEDFSQGNNATIYRYASLRNMLAEPATSQLSPYLKFGLLSARQAGMAAVKAMQNAPDHLARQNAETWLNQLIWREFYINISHFFPSVHQDAFRVEFRYIHWANQPEDFDAWRAGLTGYPIVDAGMRQLLETGWMHNRARMIAASFLTKDLLIDWRWGEKWFMKHLIDGDPAQNNGGWQWTAGTGTDAAPYFRIFNPITQSRKFDPQGVYLRRWVPELQLVPDQYIHEPWTMPVDVQRAAGCRIGIEYPKPIVNHAWARQRALDVYRAAKSSYPEK